LEYSKLKVAGLLLFVGGVQSFLAIVIAESFYPGYSTAQNFVSDLGVGPSALIFRSATFLFGILALASIYLMHQVFKSWIFSISLTLASIGMLGTVIFTEDFPLIHSILSLIFILFAGASAIVSYKFEKPPLSYVSVVLGVVTISTLVLLVSGNWLGLGMGGMEHMSLYAALMWLIGFGAYLTGQE
jgi:hypothetical membrane protein